MRGNPVKYLFMLTIISTVFMTMECSKVNKSEKVMIGISKIVAHPALDEIEKGIQDELAEEGFNNVTYDLQNADGKVSAAAEIAQKFNAEQVKIAVGIATPCAQALKNAMVDSVVIYTAVTDPVDAGLVKSLKKGEKKIAGVSDMIPVQDQIALLKKIKDIKRLGHIYSGMEADAVSLAKKVKSACYVLDIEYVESTVATPADVKKAAQKIAGGVDALYLGTDNTVILKIGAISDVARKSKLPIMTSDAAAAKKGGVFAAWGIDYYKMGRTTGKLVARVLSGERPENIPVIFMTELPDVDLFFNLDVAKELGITVPDKILSHAGSIIENGSVVKK